MVATTMPYDLRSDIDEALVLLKHILQDQEALATQKTAPSPVPDYLAPLVGWRAWESTRHDLRDPVLLKSFNRTEWIPKKPHVAACTGHGETVCANCGFVSHKAPVESCSCGIYAFSDFKRAVADLDRVSGTGHSLIFGQVWLWGKLIKHKFGYRAEFAYPKALFTDIPEFGTLYGIEVQSTSKLDEIATKFGASDFVALQDVLRARRYEW